MSLPDRLDAREARPYGDCPLSAHCWARTLDGPPNPDACRTCWQHQLGFPWARDSRRAAEAIAFMTDDERAQLDASARRDHARMTGGTR